MTLNEFLNKWSADSSEQSRECAKLRSAIAGLFDRDPRTVKNWEYKTPGYVRWILTRINTEWEQGGKTYSIFFEM